MSYLAKLQQQIGASARLCVGLDPHPEILQAWGLPVNAAGAESMSKFVVDSLAGKVAAFKPQSALFEQFGPSGIAALKRVLEQISQTSAVSILDVKRGDIGSTMQAYARAYLGADAELRADAITVSPYCGFGALEPAFSLAEATGAGVYVLCRTSNPHGAKLQESNFQDRSVAQQIIDETVARDSTGFIGLVIGATHTELKLDLSGFSGSILAPGVGAQGGTITGLRKSFGHQAKQVLPSVSRSILKIGPNKQALINSARKYTEE